MWVYQNDEMGNLQTIAFLKPIVIKEGITDFGRIGLKKPLLAMSVPQVHATSLLQKWTKACSEVRTVSSSAVPGLPLAPDAQIQNTPFSLECLF